MKTNKLVLFFLLLSTYLQADYSAYPINKWINGNCQTTLYITTTGDAGPFTVDITDKNNENVFHEENLPSNVKAVVIDAYGTFIVTFIDAFGCSTELVVEALCECDDLEYIITQPTCHLGNGKIEIISPMGSIMTSDWTQWPTGSDAPTNNALEIDGLTTGMYVATFTVNIPDPTTGDFISCQFDETFDLTKCECELEFKEETNINVNGTILCEQPNGSIKVDFWDFPNLVSNYSGSPYSLSFKWTDESGAILQESNQFDIEGLPVGVFKCTITDVSGCEIRKKFIIENKLEYNIDVDISSPCDNVKNGSIDLDVSLYHPDMVGLDLVIQWSNGETDFLIENLEAGTYNATITDNFSGCEYMESYVIDENVSTPIDDLILSDLTIPKCEGDPAIATLSIIGGNEPYVITWSPNVISTYPDDEFRFWESGTYTATVKDFCGSQKSKTFNVTVPETDYLPLSNLKVNELVDCQDYSGQTTLTFEGGQPGFKIYKRSNNQDWNLLYSSNPNLEIRTFNVPYDGIDDTYKVVDRCGNEMEVFVEWPTKCDIGLDIDISVYRHVHPNRCSNTELSGSNAPNGAIKIEHYGDSECDDYGNVKYNFSIGSETNLGFKGGEGITYFDCLRPGVYEVFYIGTNCRSVVGEVEILCIGSEEGGCGIPASDDDPIDDGGDGGDDENPFTCDDINITLDSYNGNGLISGDIFYYGPTPPFPLVDIVIRKWGGGPEVHREENRCLNDAWSVSFAADISDEFTENYDIIVELPDNTECIETEYSIDSDFDDYIDDPNFETGNLCGFEVNYDEGQGVVIDKRIVLSHGLDEGDLVSIIPLEGVTDEEKSGGLHISFWQGDESLSTWDCGEIGSNDTPSANPFMLVSDEPVRIEIRPYRYPDFNDKCAAAHQSAALFALDCEEDGFHDPSDDCSEFLVSNDNDDSYLILHNTLTTATSSAPPHVLFGVSSINDGSVNVNLVSQNNESSTLVQRNIISSLVQNSSSNLSYQSFDLGEESLGDLQTVISSAEAGSSNFTHVDFKTPFSKAPIILPTLTYQYGDKDLQIEIKQVSRFGFKVRLKDTYNSLNGEKRAFTYLAIEEGESSINGRKIIAGRTSNQINHVWSNIVFPISGGQNFDENMLPYLFAMPQTSYGASTPLIMYQNLNSTGVELKLVGANEYSSPSYFSSQTIGYLILGPDIDCICKNPITDIDFELTYPNCGISNGGFDLKPIGGVQPFSYAVNDISYSPNNNGGLSVESLQAGTYNIEIIDSKGCSYTEELILVDDGLYIDNFIAENVACDGTEFNLILEPLGGTPPYTYSWNNGDTSDNLKGVSQGNYYVTVVDSEGCIGTQQFNLRNMYLLISNEDATCGMNNGSLKAQALGISPFGYIWNNGETTEEIDNLAPGQYSVTVTDAVGCTKTASKSILPNGQIDFEYANPFCGIANGFIEVFIEGIHPISYNWGTGQTTKKIDNLVTGAYSVTTTDAQGCIKTKTISLSNSNSISLGSSGGNEGFSDGRYIPAGITVNWSFDPADVTDQLIITSDEYGVVINTGGVTRGESICCNSGNCCSDFFLGDYVNSPIDLITGSGFVLEGNSNTNCTYSGALTGSFTTTEDSYISIEVIGSTCGGSTAWSFAMSCNESTNSIHEVIDISVEEKYNNVLSNTEEVLEEKCLLYPNPANSVIYFEIFDELVGSEFKVYTPEGILVLKNTFKEVGGIISLDGFPNGLFILQIDSDKGIISKKFVVSK